MEGSNGQLQTKYQKIATEYSKIRAQANVLKKAVIDEQTRSTDLQEQLKEKEMGLRRAEQELDSLTFRNQQLTKRVTVLQEELDRVQNRSKKSRSKSSENKSQPAPLPNHILDEEFQKKIVENADLVSQISDKENEIAGLTERIELLEYKLVQCEKDRAELEHNYRFTLEKLEKERSELRKKLDDKQEQRFEELQDIREEAVKNDLEEEDLMSRNDLNHRQFGALSSPQRRSRVPGKEARPFVKSNSQDDANSEFEIAKSAELEKELNYWKAEYNMVKIKYDDLKQKEDLITSHLDRAPVEETEINNMIGRLSAPFAIPEEIQAREVKIKEYFMQQINRLIAEKHICNTKNLAMAANTEVINIHLDVSESKREKCEASLHEALSNCIALQEDKEIQEGNYKAQLSTMSEHLANMNDKLIRQTEEIQQLRFELANKNAKKGKQK